MRRSTRMSLALAASAALVTSMAAPALSAQSGYDPTTDTTSSFGPFGFTTKGLGPDAAGGSSTSYGEPSLAIAPDGQHVVASTPGCGGVCYWYSGDDGATFGTSKTAGGGGDSELDFLPDGTLISADLEITDSVMHRSFDFGKTFQDQTTAGGEQDRQWLAHSSDSSRTGGTQYLVYHDFAAEAEFASVSKNGGQTWTKGPQGGDLKVNSANQAALPAGVNCKEGNAASLVDQGVNTFSGPILVGPGDQDLYVLYSISDAQSNFDPTSGTVPPFGPTRAIVVAHSGDAGATWTNRYAVCAQAAVPTSNEPVNGAIFPWGFVDPAGTLYVVFNSTRGQEGSEHFHQYYIYSKDKGATYSDPVRLDTGLTPAQGASLYATGDAVSPGVIDVAWYQTDNGVPSDSTSVWKPHFAQVKGADTATPTFSQQALSDVPNHVGGICLQGILCGVGGGSGDRSLLDFFELAVNPQTGAAEIAYADNNRLGTNSGGNKKGEVVFAKQTLGATAPVQPGQDVPEAPYAVLVPLAGLAMLGAMVAGRRRFRLAR